MTYFEKIKEETKQNLENEKEEQLKLALNEIEYSAKKGCYSTTFDYYKIEVLEFIADYLMKEGFSIFKNYKSYIKTDLSNYFTPFIRIEWKD